MDFDYCPYITLFFISTLIGSLIYRAYFRAKRKRLLEEAARQGPVRGVDHNSEAEAFLNEFDAGDER